MGRNDQWSEKELKDAFFKMVYTLGLWIIFMMITIFIGVGKDWAFFDSSRIHAWQHILFFTWLVIVVPILIWVTVVKIWKIDALFKSSFKKDKK
ncbi:MAG: hypothetical protein ACRDE2_01305 [Chitinophagaceae bacterium]